MGYSHEALLEAGAINEDDSSTSPIYPSKRETEAFDAMWNVPLPTGPTVGVVERVIYGGVDISGTIFHTNDVSDGSKPDTGEGLSPEEVAEFQAEIMRRRAERNGVAPEGTPEGRPSADEIKSFSAQAVNAPEVAGHQLHGTSGGMEHAHPTDAGTRTPLIRRDRPDSHYSRRGRGLEGKNPAGGKITFSSSGATTGKK